MGNKTLAVHDSLVAVKSHSPPPLRPQHAVRELALAACVGTPKRKYATKEEDEAPERTRLGRSPSQDPLHEAFDDDESKEDEADDDESNDDQSDDNEPKDDEPYDYESDEMLPKRQHLQQKARRADKTSNNEPRTESIALGSESMTRPNSNPEHWGCHVWDHLTSTRLPDDGKRTIIRYPVKGKPAIPEGYHTVSSTSLSGPFGRKMKVSGSCQVDFHVHVRPSDKLARVSCEWESNRGPRGWQAYLSDLTIRSYESTIELWSRSSRGVLLAELKFATIQKLVIFRQLLLATRAQQPGLWRRLPSASEDWAESKRHWILVKFRRETVALRLFYYEASKLSHIELLHASSQLDNVPLGTAFATSDFWLRGGIRVEKFSGVIYLVLSGLHFHVFCDSFPFPENTKGERWLEFFTLSDANNFQSVMRDLLDAVEKDRPASSWLNRLLARIA